jgi:hypothetical protein
MLSDRRLSVVAELIRDHVSLDGIDRYCAETGVQSRDFVSVEPSEFDGEVFAIDGSNVSICSWSAANLNLIRAGYAVYRGRDWQRTVITYDDIFLADPRMCKDVFDPYLDQIFNQKGIDLKESDLDRLSSYFRELQEYIALDDAIREAKSGDIILYDGSFEVFEPLRESLNVVFSRAEEKGIALLAIAKSSSLFWGEGISLPFVQHTSIAGSKLLPGVPWYLNLKDKKVEHSQGKWGGETYIVRFSGRSERAFRVDAPKYLGSLVGPIFGKLAAYSCSAECLGYPHALFRAHRDIMIAEKEGALTRLKLMEMLSRGGLGLSQVKILMQDYHDILDMRQGI